MILQQLRYFLPLLTGLLLLISSCGDKQAHQKFTPIPVPVLEVKSSTIPLYKEYIGITESVAIVGIRARVKGFLVKKNFTEGQPVHKDQILFVIDPKPFEVKRDLAKAKLAKSIAERDYQHVEYLRMKNLVNKGDVSKAHYDKVAAEYREAQAQVDIDQSQLEQAEINLSYCYVHAPFDGIIGEKFVDVGNLVGGTENTLLANVVQLQPIYIQFSPSVNDYGEFLTYRKSMPFKVEATLPQDEKIKLAGQVDLINNQADVPTSTVLMRATVDNLDNMILPGIYLKVKIKLSDNQEVILIPEQSIIETQGQLTVMVVNEENKVESKEVKSSGLYQHQYMIEQGLKPGDKLIIGGLQKLKPGMVVKPEVRASHG